MQHAISKSDARRIWLRAQRLDVAEPFGSGPEATRAAIEHLGYVQIDTINVIERCHHHILYSRIPNYARDDLAHAQSHDKSIFEYWTHALSYVPVRDIAFYTGLMRRYRRTPHKWYGEIAPKDRRKVMRLLKAGPLSIRDIDDDELVEKNHDWASKKPSKKALQVAFFDGTATISARTGMLKTYDLSERHFGWATLPKAATEPQIIAHLLDRALRAQGLVSLDSICHLDAKRKPAMRRLIEQRLRKKLLIPLAVDGAGKVEHWIEPETLDMPISTPAPLTHILSPFDPLVIQRKRLALLFDYQHLFEAYVPKEKRKLGYFALPVLVGDEVVAALDLKTDRQERKLLIQKWTWVGRGQSRAHKKLIEAELDRFERFQLA